MTARSAALSALESFRRSGAFGEDILDRVTTAAALSPRDSALCANICLGVVQNTTLLDFYISRYSTLPMNRLEPKVLDILRLSAYQIVFLDRIPPSAAVSEGVALCKKATPRASGLCNAVLRRIAENRDNLPPVPGFGGAEYLATRYSHPLWLARELISQHGYDFTEGFFAANNRQVPITAQVNTLKCTAEELLERLEQRGIKTEAGPLPDCLYLTGAGKLTDIPEFRDGLFYVQDAAARRAVTDSAAAPGMTVLDACAAPGGKSFAAAIQMKNSGRIIACDIGEKKLPKIIEGAARLGIDIIETRVMDARAPEGELLGSADLVIADCPCSGLGVIRKKPEIRWKKPEDLAALPGIQLDILSSLADCVKPGGTLLYATCTVRRCENEDVAQAFLAQRPDFSLKEKMTTFWPQLQKTDGFFICAMVKSI